LETVTLMTWLLDALLSTMLLILGWRALHAADLYESIILFIAFGLLMALVWVRLGAVDVAMAEAAVGAGVTGAMLLTALANLKSTSPKEPE